MYNSNQPMPSPVSSTMECFDLMSPSPSSSTTHSPKRREEIDQRLAQAFNYLLVGGACDSPTTFNNRVNLIEEMLAEGQSLRGRNFDVELHSRVQAMVRDVRQQFQLTVEWNPSSTDSEDGTDGYTMNSRPIIALNRLSESSSPSRSSFISRLLGTKVQKDTSLQEDSPIEQRTCEYGGPGNEPEIWHKSSTASTHFKHIRNAEHRHNRDQIESGTRFRLPLDLSRDWEAIDQFATNDKPACNLGSFNDTVHRTGSNYGQQAEVEDFRLGDQGSPSKLIDENELRRSMNDSPVTEKYKIIWPSQCRPFLQVYTVPDTPSATPPASPKLPTSEVPKTIIRSSPGAAMRVIKRAIDASIASDKAAEAARTADVAPRTSKVVTRSVTKLKVTATIPQKKVSTPQKKPKSATDFTVESTPRIPSTNQPCVLGDHFAKKFRQKAIAVEQIADAVDTPKTNETPKSSKTIKSGTKRKHSEGSMPYTPKASATKKKLRFSTTPERNIDCPAPSQLDNDAADPNFVQSPALNVMTRANSAKLAKKKMQPAVSNGKGAVPFRRVTRGMSGKNKT